MQNKYDKHFLMDTTTVCEYIKDKVDFFDKDDKITAKEIGDGNINYVFIVYSEKTGKSLVVKQADTLLRSSGRPLDMYRNKIEADILKLESELAPGFVPDIIYYDENMFALVMEDISAYKSLRTELMNGVEFPTLAEDISTFLVKTLLPTTDLVMSRAEKKIFVKKFINIELCDISEVLVFTEPYYNFRDQNIVVDEQIEFVEEHLYSNSDLKVQVGKLRDKFMNCAQALLHGDMHSGSIFANQSGLKIIDPEFAFYGPMGYDIGNVIGNMFFSLAYAKYVNPTNLKFYNYMEETIQKTTDLFLEKFSKEYDNIVEFKFYVEEGFKKSYIKEVLADSFGYAGTEIIRRVVGGSKVKEISSVTDLNIKIPLERSLIKLGIHFIMNSEKLKNGKDAVEAFRLISA